MNLQFGKSLTQLHYLVLATLCSFTTILYTPLVQGELLSGYLDCAYTERFDNQCLPNVSKIEERLNDLHHDRVRMDIDRQSWRGFQKSKKARPSDDLTAFINADTVIELLKSWDLFAALFRGEIKEYLSAFQKAKKHIQSIQYIDDSSGNRYLLTSIGDETDTDAAAIQLVKTDQFAAGAGGGWDDIASQRLLNQDSDALLGVADYNHPGGSQLIGNYLFLALEDFDKPTQPPATGVWQINPKQECSIDGECIKFMYKIPHPNIGGVETGDNHQATVAVARLSDKTFLLAACVYEECDYINFYKTAKPTESEEPTLAEDPGFQFIGQWQRPEEDATNDDWWKTGWTEKPPKDHWSDCGPQNMNFAIQDDGGIYLVLFGGETVLGIASCDTGMGFQDNLYGYKVAIDKMGDLNTPVYDVKLNFTNKVRVLPNPSQCSAPFRLAPFFHGLNFLAGSGLWLRPDGKNTIAFLATEHYDSCRTVAIPVNGKTRWGASENWKEVIPISVDRTTVTVDEGDLAVNTGNYLVEGLFELDSSVGTITPETGDAWQWYWYTTDGPDDSQVVTLTRSDLNGAMDSTTFDLVVNNVPPTADAGPDQLVECIYLNRISLDASGSSDPGLDTLGYKWVFTSVPGSVPPFDDPVSMTPSFLPTELGNYFAKVTVTDDDGANDKDDVKIVFEDTTPPVISNVTVTPDVLWPPNRKMVAIEVDVSVADACDIAPVCLISSIESNEPESRRSDADITSQLTANIRAKRLGTGTGRIYTIAVECSDHAGNVTPGITAVTVPHNWGSTKK